MELVTLPSVEPEHNSAIRMQCEWRAVCAYTATGRSQLQSFQFSGVNRINPNMARVQGCRKYAFRFHTVKVEKQKYDTLMGIYMCVV